MTNKQKEIEETKRQILATEERLAQLKKKLEQLDKLPDFLADKKLYNFVDFPNDSITYFAIVAQYEDKDYHDPTIRDLIRCTEKGLLKYPGMGKARLKKLTDWMEKYGIEFLSKVNG